MKFSTQISKVGEEISAEVKIPPLDTKAALAISNLLAFIVVHTHQSQRKFVQFLGH